MGLAAGTRLGPYEIQSLLGAGGMGEVYRARDTRLERDVAIKILPATLSLESSSRQRLEREAKSISRLSHPHICTLHDVGHDDGKDFLVMELIEGETLEHRLEKGPLTPEQTLRYAVQIADALTVAHRHGIVHRDLKPANVMLTKTGAKLMDFGLAKDSGPAPMASVLTEMTAERSKLTAEGTIVGTFQYMAPEQLEGRDIDARADIFSFGALLYEMLTGKTAFTGKSRASLIAAILTAEPPPITALRPMTPVNLERVVKKCLAKDPDDRWQSASDLATELRWMAEAGSHPAVAATKETPWKRATWLLAAVAAVAIAIAALTWFKAQTDHAPAMLFHAAIPFAVNDVAVSPNGRSAALVAYSESTNNYVLWLYPIGGQQPKALEGTQGASYPFWSPDGKALGFFADGKLKKIDIEKSQVQVICEAANGRGGTWNQDGIIVFSPDAQAGLHRVASSGGLPSEFLKPDPKELETSVRWPTFLPDGRHFLFLGANFTGHPEKDAIYVGTVGSAERHRLVESSGNAVYVEPGYLLYMRGRALMAQRMNIKDYALTGDAQIVAENVLTFPAVHHAVFSAVDGKTLIAQTGVGANISRLTWFDRGGKPVRTLGEPGWFNNVRLSPDSSKIAVDETDQDGQDVDVWIHDATTGAKRRLTFTPSLDQVPIWSPDGKQIIYSSNQNLGWKVYRKNSDGASPEEAIAGFDMVLASAWDWSPDGQTVTVRKLNQLWYLSLNDRSLKPLFESSWTIKNARFSPNGRWMAYASNESGKMEVYVVSFPPGSGKWQVSSGGGQEPVWRRDGKELFFISSDGKIMAAPVTATDRFDSGTPVALFQTHRRQPISSQDVFSYDVSKDGKQFLVTDKSVKAEATPPSIYLNWTREMEK
jgi:Tol biopolymer transport system component/predicted Ser/Thr protein kinase